MSKTADLNRNRPFREGQSLGQSRQYAFAFEFALTPQPHFHAVAT